MKKSNFCGLVMLALGFSFIGCDTGNGNINDNTYIVGDTGPAEGIIFYVKDSYSDGWQYLEALPASEILRATNWVPHNETEFIDKLMDNTSTAIGSGKQNTENILEKLDEWECPTTDEGNREVAAKLCAECGYGGKDDWFLPSKEELNEMYRQRDFLNVESLDKIIDEKWPGFSGKANKGFWTSSEFDNDMHGYSSLVTMATSMGT